jgi:ABC-type branched-subunit amino acid transport system substrate-binding protein
VSRAVAIRAVVVFAVLLTACSGDDDDGVDTTSSTVRRTTTTQAQTDSTEPAIEPEAEPTYTFGFLAPGEGQLAPFVPSQEQALALAIEDINAAGGLLGGPVRSIRDD